MKVNYKLFLSAIYILSFLLAFTSANSQEFEGCHAKKKYRFEMLKKEGVHIDTSLVKTTGVYICKDSIIDLDKKIRTTYSFYRFFDNGKVYRSCRYLSFPDEAELNGLNYGTYGEYKTEGNTLVMEGYSPAGYMWHYFEVNSDTIISSGTKRRNSKSAMVADTWRSLKFVLYKCALTSKPFW